MPLINNCAVDVYDDILKMYLPNGYTIFWDASGFRPLLTPGRYKDVTVLLNTVFLSNGTHVLVPGKIYIKEQSHRNIRLCKGTKTLSMSTR